LPKGEKASAAREALFKAAKERRDQGGRIGTPGTEKTSEPGSVREHNEGCPRRGGKTTNFGAYFKKGTPGKGGGEKKPGEGEPQHLGRRGRTGAKGKKQAGKPQ